MELEEVKVVISFIRKKAAYATPNLPEEPAPGNTGNGSSGHF